MRITDFVGVIQARFKTQSNEPVATVIARAMTDANHDGVGTFTHEGVDFRITAQWVDGCINYDCNPATCYTDWTLTEVTPEG